MSSVEVDCNTFIVDGSWLTLQNHIAVSNVNQAKCTRGSTIKSFQNLNYPDLTVFTKHRNDKPDPIGCFVHHGGVEQQLLKYCPRDVASFLHFRKPMYDPQINRQLCNAEYAEVKKIALKAKEYNNEL